MGDVTVRHRALTVLAVAAGASAVAAAVTAFTVFRPGAGVVVDSEPAALSTEEPDTPESTNPGASSIAPSAPASADSSDATPEPTTNQPKERVPPATVTIDDLDISQGIRPVGLEDSGEMEVPDVDEIGWYVHGAVPGHPGATVLVAHVWWGDSAGPFHNLGALEPGAPIEVRLDDDTAHDYSVVERAVYDKDALPSELWRNSGPETLVLITCGGAFDRSQNRFRQNIVVSAVPSETVPRGVGGAVPGS